MTSIAQQLLLRVQPGAWVVFRDGVAHSFHRDYEAAHEAAIAKFGMRGRHVVAQVVARRSGALKLSARRLFRVSARPAADVVVPDD